MILSFIVEIVVSIILLLNVNNYQNDTVKINELTYGVKENFNQEELYSKYYTYSILDMDDNLIYKTSDNTSLSLNEAYKNKDTINTINVSGVEYRILVNHRINEIIEQNNKSILITIIVISLFELFILSLYYIYLYESIHKPFKDMKGYASRISSGNLDVPLKMDSGNTFGVFTESFDIMREELKKARKKEKEANDSKRELVAKLSHDIKTPVASIKSTSELGYAISKDEKDKAYFDTINKKADQINTLVSNLLISSLEDLDEIKINPSKLDSYVLYELIKNSDYLLKVEK
jgi:signal transduction histidine kinase